MIPPNLVKLIVWYHLKQTKSKDFLIPIKTQDVAVFSGSQIELYFLFGKAASATGQLFFIC